MPRTKREKSRTGIYHVIFRGFKEQEIFKDDQDYYKFIQTLKDVKKIERLRTLWLLSDKQPHSSADKRGAGIHGDDVQTDRSQVCKLV